MTKSRSLSELSEHFGTANFPEYMITVKTLDIKDFLKVFSVQFSERCSPGGSAARNHSCTLLTPNLIVLHLSYSKRGDLYRDYFILRITHL